MNNIVILGATSAIAQAVARKLASPQRNFLLVGRNEDRLTSVAADLGTRGVTNTEILTVDLCDTDSHQSILARAIEVLGSIDLIVIAHGTLPEQEVLQSSYPATLQCLQENALSVISLATVFANYFDDCGAGSLVVISSVAGDRGRQSNYVYGTAKGAVSTFMQGLRNRLHGRGVQVLTVKPGLVATPMTARFEKGVLWASPDTVATDIVRAIEKRRNVIYTPFFWRYIMLIIRAIPESIFKRMKL